MSSTAGVPSNAPVEEMDGKQMALVIGTSIGMIVFLYVTRYVCNILVIDICILGDWGAYKKIFWCCCKRQLLEEQEERRRRRRFENIGASNDPVGVLYDSVLCSEESRKTFLQLITDTELLTSMIEQCNESAKKGAALETGSDGHPDSKMGKEVEIATDDVSIDTCENNNTCAICLGDLDEEGEKCYVRNCGHSFHRSCIKEWIARSLSCPVCRKQMIENSKLIEYMSKNRELFIGDTEANNSTPRIIDLGMPPNLSRIQR